MGAEWNFRQIWITIDNSFVKWAPERCKLMIGCYHVCSCPGEVRSQGSSRHAIDWITKNILVLGVLSVNHLNLCTFPVGSGAVRPHVSGSGFVFHCRPSWSEDRYTSERTHMFKSKWKHFPHSLRNYFQFKWIIIRIIMFKICVWHTWSQNKVVVSWSVPVEYLLFEGILWNLTCWSLVILYSDIIYWWFNARKT